MSVRSLRRHNEPERQIQELSKEILDEIRVATKRSEKDSKCYVCYKDLKHIWRKQRRIRILIKQSNPLDEQVDFIQNHMIIILSTLVQVGADRCLSQFVERFFKPYNSVKALFVDDDLPIFSEDKVTFLDSEPAVKKQFFDHQFRFTPVKITIERAQVPQKIHPRQRLPFEKRTKNVGAGGFGTVDCVGISARYLINNTNPGVNFVTEKVSKAHE